MINVKPVVKVVGVTVAAVSAAMDTNNIIGGITYDWVHKHEEDEKSVESKQKCVKAITGIVVSSVVANYACKIPAVTKMAKRILM